MKGRIFSFLSGAIVTLLLVGLPVTAMAASGALTIEVSPIKVMVNGEVFQPKDANGNDVMVFVHQGTTYAPLRALAEAYGLEVGYDAENNIATVTSPTATLAPTALTTQSVSYADFEKAWTVKEKPVTNYGNEKIFTVKYSGPLSMSEFKTWWKSFDEETIKEYAERMTAEAQSLVPGYTVTASFSYGQYNLGSAYADGFVTGSNFAGAKVWIK